MNIYKTVLIAFVFASLFTGCFDVDREFKTTRNYILNNIESEFERENEFAIGSFTLSIINKFVDFDTDDEMIRIALSEISKIQISIYNNISHELKLKDKTYLQTLNAGLVYEGWQTIIRRRSSHENTLILFRANKETKQELLVINIDNYELAIVGIEGNIYGILNEMIKDPDFQVNFASN